MLFLSNMPPASALGCLPNEFFSFEGPFITSGDAKLDGTVQRNGEAVQVFVMEPGDVANISYRYFYWDTFFNFSASIKPVIHLVKSDADAAVAETPPWLQISKASPEEITLKPGDRATVTASLSVKDDALPGEYHIDTYGELSEGCGYASKIFLLKIEPRTETQTTTTTVTTHTSDGFSSAVAKVGRSYAVQVASGISSENEKLVTIGRNDSRLNVIVQYLNSSKVKAVTLKTATITEGNRTTTVSVTIPYSLGNYLIFMLWNGSTVHFTYTWEDIWFETDQAIYQMSLDPAFRAFLSTILQESLKTTTSTITITKNATYSSSTAITTTTTEMITTNEVDTQIYAWAIGATLATVILAVILLVRRRTIS